MRIGISVTSAHNVEDVRAGSRYMIERTQAAREAGLDSLSLGDHHAMAVPYYQNTPMLGRLLAEWPSDKPAGCLFLVPLWHPVLMAEQIGTLATLLDGPFVVQTGIGAGADQFSAMHADLGSRGAVTDERIQIVQALLAGEAVDGATVSPRPPGAVEWWIGAGADAGLERAARLGDCWYAGPNLTPQHARERLAVYLEHCAANGREPTRIAIRRDIIVTRSGSEATRLGDELIAGGYRGMPRDAVVYGDPQAVAAAFAELGDMGFTDVIVRAMTVPQAVAIESIELLAEVGEQVG